MQIAVEVDGLTERLKTLALGADTFEEQKILGALVLGLATKGTQFTITKGGNTLLSFSTPDREEHSD